jgi:hypothetical protein
MRMQVKDFNIDFSSRIYHSDVGVLPSSLRRGRLIVISFESRGSAKRAITTTAALAVLVATILILTIIVPSCTIVLPYNVIVPH